MFAHERYKKILEILDNENSVKVSALTSIFNVSLETIRRDLEFLEKEDKLKRVYGGAVKKANKIKTLSYPLRLEEGKKEKIQIAQTAMKYIQEEQTLALDAGSTNFYVAKHLKKHFRRLTVITNSLAIANELSEMDEYNIFVSGGKLDSTREAFAGDIACRALSDFRVDIVFLGVSGVSLTEGITDYFTEQLSVQKILLNISQQNIILADSSKIGNIALHKVCDFSDVNLIITDSNLCNDTKMKYLESGIEIAN